MMRLESGFWRLFGRGWQRNELMLALYVDKVSLQFTHKTFDDVNGMRPDAERRGRVQAS
jgi:hypothetical protein